MNIRFGLTSLLVALLGLLTGCPGSTGSSFSLGTLREVSLEQGKSVSVDVFVKRSGAVTPVNLSLDNSVALPPGLTVDITPPSTTYASKLKFTATAALLPGDYPVKIKGEDGTGTTNATITVKVASAPFNITPSSDVITVARGDSSEINISLSRTTGFTGAVTLTLEGAPAGVTAAFTPASLSGSTVQSKLKVTVARTAAVGDTAISIKATSGSSNQIKPLTLRIQLPPDPDFSVELSTPTLSFTTTAPQTATVTVRRVGGFDADILLSLEKSDGTPVPAGITPDFTPSNMKLADSTSTLKITLGSGIQNGSYALRIKGQAGTISRTVNLSLNVNIQPNFSVVVGGGSEQATIRQGKTGTVNFTASPVAGFTGQVNLRLRSQGGQPLPAGVTATIAPITFDATQSPIVRPFDISVSLDVQPGPFLLQLEGVPAAAPSEPARIATFTLVVKPETDPDFLLFLPSPAEYGDIRDNRFEFNISAGRLGGFSDPINVSVVDPPASFENIEIIPARLLNNASNDAVIRFTPRAAGTYGIRVRTESGGLVREGVMTIRVSDFNIGFENGQDLTGNRSVAPGGTGTLNVIRSVPFTPDVSLKLLAKNSSGVFVDAVTLPEIESVTFTPNNVLPGRSDTITPVSIMSIKVRSTATAKIIDMKLQGDATGVTGVQSRFATFKMAIQP
jgi:hypothetical protein